MTLPVFLAITWALLIALVIWGATTWEKHEKHARTQRQACERQSPPWSTAECTALK